MSIKAYVNTMLCQRKEDVQFPEDAEYVEALELMKKHNVGVLRHDHPLLNLRGPNYKNIFYQGNIDALNQPVCAVIGTRQPTQEFETLTRAFVNRLNQCGVSCLSGGALGHDIIAHKHWLETYSESHAKPIIVLPRIIDYYPRSHAGIYKQLLDKGALILSHNLTCEDNELIPELIARDALQAQFSDAVCPIQMSCTSGTWHAVKHAYKLERKILVLNTPLQSEGLDQLKSFPTQDCKGYKRLAEELGKDWNKNIVLVDKSNIIETLKGLRMNEHEIELLAREIFTGLYSRKKKRNLLQSALNRWFPHHLVEVKKDHIKINGNHHSVACLCNESTHAWIWRGNEYKSFLQYMGELIEKFYFVCY